MKPWSEQNLDERIETAINHHSKKVEEAANKTLKKGKREFLVTTQEMHQVALATLTALKYTYNKKESIFYEGS